MHNGEGLCYFQAIFRSVVHNGRLKDILMDLMANCLTHQKSCGYNNPDDDHPIQLTVLNESHSIYIDNTKVLGYAIVDT